jgi:benzoyl-CoA 2,3-dioxygenase component A
MTCPIQAIHHNDDNVVVDAEACNFCMDCIPVCPTGSIDEWRVVNEPYSMEEQFEWMELPEQEDIQEGADTPSDEAIDDAVAALLAEAHKGAGGRPVAPKSAAKPSINLHNLGKPAVAKVTGNISLTNDPDHDVRHIILDFGQTPFPVLEGQSIGVIAPGKTDAGQDHLPRLYSVSSPRDGERQNYNNISLTIKREAGGICSNYLCDLSVGDEVRITGPFGATFLLPDDPNARLLMICTGTGSAPMRAFTMRRQRAIGEKTGGMVMFFGARTADSLPYFGPLKKVPENILEQHLVFSRDGAKEYVQDRMMKEEDRVAEMLNDPNTHIYICGLRGMEEGVDFALTNIAESIGQQWSTLRDVMRDEGRFHVETY